MQSTVSIDEAISNFSPIQLRDMCICPECRHPGNGQRFMLAENLDLEIRITNTEFSEPWIYITFSDGHLTRLDSGLILGEVLQKAPVLERSISSKKLWMGSELEMTPITWVDFKRIKKLEALKQLSEYGFMLITEVPIVEGAVLDVISEFGFTRETNYGRVFDVRVEHSPNNLAFTNLEIPPHTDNPYRNPVPTIQLLHCLESEVEGGESGLVDGFKSAQLLHESNPKSFEMLSQSIFEFTYRNENTYLSHSGPIIGLDVQGDVCEIRWNDRSMQSYRGKKNPSDIYAALRDFSKILNSPGNIFNFKLAPGDCVVFDNTRVLHSRTSFDGSGKRHLQGAYADLDGVFSSIKILEEVR